MTSPSLTRRLLEAARKGQEIVNRHGVPVVHKPRVETDPRPWLTAPGHGRQSRYSASECMARLALPVPAGTVLELVSTRKRGRFVGLAELPWLVQVELDGQTVEISRTLLRKVA